MIFPKMYIVFILCTKFPHHAINIKNPFHGGHLVKCKMAAIQDLGQDGNIAFPISYTISFPKMYCFHTLCYLQAEILTKTCFMVAICKQMQDGGRIGLDANVNIVFSVCTYYKLSKYV